MSHPLIGIAGRNDRSARPPHIDLFSISHEYVHAVALGGGAPVIIPPYLEETTLRAVFDRLDGLVLSGGGDVSPTEYGEQDGGLLWSVDEQRDRSELLLARWAVAEARPLLAICRGIQVLNVATGGKLIQDIPTQVPDALTHSTLAGRPLPDIVHTVKVTAKSRLASLVGSGALEVNSAHHQAVETAGEGLCITARAPDGVIEGLEAPDHPFCLGVQWHPEVMVDPVPKMRHLFEGLIEAARGE